jgi:hypothetical protein
MVPLLWVRQSLARLITDLANYQNRLCSIYILSGRYVAPFCHDLTKMLTCRHNDLLLPQLCVCDSLFRDRVSKLISRTSAVLEHSVAGTITTAQAIIIAIGKPLMAKLADV